MVCLWQYIYLFAVLCSLFVDDKGGEKEIGCVSVFLIKIYIECIFAGGANGLWYMSKCNAKQHGLLNDWLFKSIFDYIF